MLPLPQVLRSPALDRSDLSPHPSIYAENIVFPAEEFALMKSEIERLRVQVEQHLNPIAAESAIIDEFPDPANEKSIWNLNSISVLMWKSWLWPKNQRWNHDKELFEPKLTHEGIFRSRSQKMMESIVCPLLFTVFPLIFVFFEMCILSGIIDQGFNQKSHIYGDGLYNSPSWRFSGQAYLRSAFVPVLDSNGVQIGMTSAVDTFNHSMLHDRPEGEATRCLDDDYLMPVNKYKVLPSPPRFRTSYSPHPCVANSPRLPSLHSAPRSPPRTILP
jgi:hypothetical protein